MDLCVNCGIATRHTPGRRPRPLDDETILSVIRQWQAPQPVSSSDYVCQACWNLALSPQAHNQEKQVGHRNVCLRCGRSLASRMNHLLHTKTTRESRIYNVIQEWIIPRTIHATSQICHACWVAADRASVHLVTDLKTSSQQDIPHVKQPQKQEIRIVSPNEEVSSSIQPTPSIVLTEYMRARETESRCFIEGCKRAERHRVPLSTRKILFDQFKYYIPENNRLCDQHLVLEAGDFLDSLRSNYVQTFTEKHIYDMISLSTFQNAGNHLGQQVRANQNDDAASEGTDDPLAHPLAWLQNSFI